MGYRITEAERKHIIPVEDLEIYISGNTGGNLPPLPPDTEPIYLVIHDTNGVSGDKYVGYNLNLPKQRVTWQENESIVKIDDQYGTHSQVSNVGWDFTLSGNDADGWPSGYLDNLKLWRRNDSSGYVVPLDKLDRLQIDKTLRISGDVTANSDVTVEMDLTISGITTHKDDVYSEKDTYTEGKATVSGDLTVTKGGLYVDTGETILQEVNIKKNLDVDETLTVNGNSTLDGTALIKKTLTVNGNSALKGTLTVTKKTLLNNELEVPNMITTLSGLLVKNDTDIRGNTSISGKTSIYDDTFISGNVAISGDGYISGNVAISGNQDLSGNLNVLSDAYISGNTSISGNEIISGNLNIDGNQTLSGTLFVSGLATISGAEISGLHANSGIIDHLEVSSGLFWDLFAVSGRFADLYAMSGLFSNSATVNSGLIVDFYALSGFTIEGTVQKLNSTSGKIEDLWVTNETVSNANISGLTVWNKATISGLQVQHDLEVNTISNDGVPHGISDTAGNLITETDLKNAQLAAFIPLAPVETVDDMNAIVGLEKDQHYLIRVREGGPGVEGTYQGVGVSGNVISGDWTYYDSNTRDYIDRGELSGILGISTGQLANYNLSGKVETRYIPKAYIRADDPDFTNTRNVVSHVITTVPDDRNIKMEYRKSSVGNGQSRSSTLTIGTGTNIHTTAVSSSGVTIELDDYVQISGIVSASGKIDYFEVNEKTDLRGEIGILGETTISGKVDILGDGGLFVDTESLFNVDSTFTKNALIQGNLEVQKELRVKGETTLEDNTYIGKAPEASSSSVSFVSRTQNIPRALIEFFMGQRITSIDLENQIWNGPTPPSDPETISNTDSSGPNAVAAVDMTPSNISVTGIQPGKVIATITRTDGNKGYIGVTINGDGSYKIDQSRISISSAKFNFANLTNPNFPSTSAAVPGKDLFVLGSEYVSGNLNISGGVNQDHPLNKIVLYSSGLTDDEYNRTGPNAQDHDRIITYVNGNEQVLATIKDIDAWAMTSGYVTINTNQVITGQKWFSGGLFSDGLYAYHDGIGPSNDFDYHLIGQFSGSVGPLAVNVGNPLSIFNLYLNKHTEYWNAEDTHPRVYETGKLNNTWLPLARDVVTTKFADPTSGQILGDIFIASSYDKISAKLFFDTLYAHNVDDQISGTTISGGTTAFVLESNDITFSGMDQYTLQLEISGYQGKSFSGWFNDISGEISGLRTEISGEISGLRTEISGVISGIDIITTTSTTGTNSIRFTSDISGIDEDYIDVNVVSGLSLVNKANKGFELGIKQIDYTLSGLNITDSTLFKAERFPTTYAVLSGIAGETSRAENVETDIYTRLPKVLNDVGFYTYSAQKTAAGSTPTYGWTASALPVPPNATSNPGIANGDEFVLKFKILDITTGDGVLNWEPVV
jgi:predicted acyltransferase (DUF342 family)